MSSINQINIMRLQILNNINDSSKDSIFNIMLDNAGNIALNTLYPYDFTKELPDNDRMKIWQVRCAIELYKRLGTMNVQSYSENGISVQFLNGLVSSDLLKELGPSSAGVIK